MKLAKEKKQNSLDIEIEALLSEMSETDKKSKEYTVMAQNLLELYKIKNQEKGKKVSSDALVGVVGNLVGLILIMKYEEAKVISGRAFSYLRKSGV